MYDGPAARALTDNTSDPLSGIRHVGWAAGSLVLLFKASKDHPVVLSGLGGPEDARVTGATQPIVELIATG